MVSSTARLCSPNSSATALISSALGRSSPIQQKLCPRPAQRRSSSNVCSSEDGHDGPACRRCRWRCRPPACAHGSRWPGSRPEQLVLGDRVDGALGGGRAAAAAGRDPPPGQPEHRGDGGRGQQDAHRHGGGHPGPGQQRRLLRDRQHPDRRRRPPRPRPAPARSADVGQRAVGVDDAGAGALVPGAGQGQRAALDPGHHLRPGQPGEPGPDQRRDPGRDGGGEAGPAHRDEPARRRPTATPGRPRAPRRPPRGRGWSPRPAARPASTLATASTPS